MPESERVANAQSEKKEEVKTIEVLFQSIVNTFIEAYGKNASDEGKKNFNILFSQYLKQEVSKHQCQENYNLLILFDNTIIIKGDSDRIYRAINNFINKEKPLLLVLLSRGGEPAPAYLIGKLCQEFCNNKFVVVVPRYAKSAATLIACAAHEIHMGSLSELGPIDPQIDKMPALGLKHSIEHIADLANKYPASGEMFARYLKLTIEPIQIGYYERVAQSAMQYAEKLLSTHSNALKSTPAEIAEKLVYGYKDHGFVIDKGEASDIFGQNIVKGNTPEYALGNTIYNILSKVEDLADIFRNIFYFIGSLDSEPDFTMRKGK